MLVKGATGHEINQCWHSYVSMIHYEIILLLIEYIQRNTFADSLTLCPLVNEFNYIKVLFHRMYECITNLNVLGLSFVAEWDQS